MRLEKYEQLKSIFNTEVQDRLWKYLAKLLWGESIKLWLNITLITTKNIDNIIVIKRGVFLMT